MKRDVRKILVLCLFFILLISFVSIIIPAQTTDEIAKNMAEGTKTVVTGIGGYFSELLAPFFGEKEMLTRVFLAILLGMVIYTVIGSMFKPESRLTKIIITFLITAISLLALPSGFLESIITQYGAMGAAILSIIPFMIMLVFSVRVESLLVARVVWIFYMIYYFALYIYKAVIVSGGQYWWGVFTLGFGGAPTEVIPYSFAFYAGLLIFFLIKPIRRAVFRGKMDSIKESGRKVATKAKLLHELQSKELRESYGPEESGNI